MNNNKPKYIKIFEEIRDKINSGEYKSNQRLPSKRDLAINYNVSLNTIINAYDLLLDEGYIYSIEKKGYFVSSQLVVSVSNQSVEAIAPKQYKYKYDFTSQNVEGFIDTNWKRLLRENLNNDSYLSKSPLEGDLGLRCEIQKHLEINRGIKASPKNIIIGSGIEMMEGILKCIPIDNITLENPGYHKLSQIGRAINKDIKYISLDNNGALIPDYQTILYTTPFNQFPTGVKMSISRKKEIINYLNETNSYLIEDDFDAEFRIYSNPTTALYSLDSNHVIFFSTFSTTMYPGLRIAYTILPDSILDKYKKMYNSYTCPAPLLLQLTLKDFISKGYYASHLNKRKKLYITKRKKCIEALAKYNIKYNDKANYLSLLISLDREINDSLMDELKKNSINIQALESFDINHIKYNNLILGYTSIKLEEIDSGIRLIKKISSEN